EGLSGRVRRFADGRFRPVRGLRGVPRGWRAVLPDARARLALQFLLQPGALPDSWAFEENTLAVTGWDVTAKRQTGLDARVRQATARDQEAVAGVLCAACLKTRLWAGSPLVGTVLAGQPGQIPCAEPCPVFVRAVRDRLSGQPGRPEGLPADD
ncbi:MAG TPA: cobalamin biosynthesis protein CbiX, partial [Deinococcales bacterium]|nr:cobalamin biosynthesis protein CbiX [Deinococcales bacterium]